MSLTIQATQNRDVYQNTQAENRKSFFAGNLTAQKEESKSHVEEKREYARKKALSLVESARDRDKESAQGIADLKDKKTEKLQELAEIQGRKADVEANKELIRKDYGVEKDSVEQKDLELLEKYQDYKNGLSVGEFSEDEIGRLKELQELPRTEYQNKVLELNASKGAINELARQKEAEIIGMAQSISSARIEQMKSQDMSKAQDSAEQIMEAASQAIVGELMQDGVDHIEEAQKEEQEKAEEAAKEKEEQEEKLEQAKDNREEQQEILEGISEAEHMNQTVPAQQKMEEDNNIKDAIQKIIQDQGLTNEDLKGICIDFNF